MHSGCSPEPWKSRSGPSLLGQVLTKVSGVLWGARKFSMVLLAGLKPCTPRSRMFFGGFSGTRGNLDFSKVLTLKKTGFTGKGMKRLKPEPSADQVLLQSLHTEMYSKP